MTKTQAFILSLTVAAGAVYVLWNTTRDEAPAADNQNQGGTNMNTPTPSAGTGYGNTRGYRNNNPLNIRFNVNNNWKGKVLANTDGAFEQFVSMPYGFRAALYLFRKYIRQGYNTVERIVGKWAPPTENHTDKYLAFVVNKTQLDPYATIKPGNADVLKLLAHAMAWYENGTAPQWPDIEEGWELL